MKLLLNALFLLLVAIPVYAFDPVMTDITQPYEITTIDESDASASDYLGELSGFPVMYEVTSDRPFTLQAKVHQLYRAGEKPVPFSLIAIRQNERGGGVTEVARLNPADEDWQKIKSSQLGMTTWVSPVVTAAVESGTYRVEISTPENAGKYLLSFGTQETNDGYFATLAGIRRTQKFFDYSIFKMLSSSYVYYPLGIFFILFVGQRIWRYRKLIAPNAA